MKQSYIITLLSLILMSGPLSARSKSGHNKKSKAKCFDYIICGGGTAGCTIAERISKNPCNCVLVLELGDRRDDEDVVANSGGVSEALLYAEFYYQCAQEAQKKIPQKLNFQFTTGRLLGGGSCINGQQYVRPTKFVMEQWQELTGNDIWSRDNALQNFKEMETFFGNGNLPNPEVAHGFKGRLGNRLEYADNVPLIVDLFVERLTAVAQANLGLLGATVQEIDDYNAMTDETTLGTFSRWQIFANNDGKRSCASNAFLTPAVEARKNVTLITRANIIRILFKGKKAVGVLYNIGGKEVKVFAKKKVICSMGIYTPKLLQLSGIGNRNELEPMGIPVIVDNPNVGQHMKQHEVTSATFEFIGGVEPGPDEFPNSAVGDLFSGGGWLPTPNDPQIDDVASPRRLQVIGIAVPSTPTTPSLYIMATLDNQPQSVGFTRLQSADPDRIPISSDNIFGEDIDFETYVNYYKKVVGGMANDPMWSQSYELIVPSLEVIEDDDTKALKDFIAATLTHSHHWMGMCRMGKSPKESVCNSTGEVWGTRNLMVCDDTLVPFAQDGNTASSAFLFGWTLGNLILEGEL